MVRQACGRALQTLHGQGRVKTVDIKNPAEAAGFFCGVARAAIHSNVAQFVHAISTAFSDTTFDQTIRTTFSNAAFDQTIRTALGNTALDQTIRTALGNTAFDQTI